MTIMAPRELQQRDGAPRDLRGLLRSVPLRRKKRNKIRKKKRKRNRRRTRKNKEKTENLGKKKVKGAEQKSKKDEVIDVKDATPEIRPRSQPKPKMIQTICSLKIDPSKKLDVTALEYLRSIVRTGLVVDHSKRYVCFMTL